MSYDLASVIPQPAKRRRVWPWYVAGAVLLAGLVVAAVMVFRPSSSPATAPTTPAASPTPDAVTAEACREAADDNANIDTITPDHMEAVGKLASRSTDPGVRSAGLALESQAQVALENSENFAARVDAITADINLGTACINAGFHE